MENKNNNVEIPFKYLARIIVAVDNEIKMMKLDPREVMIPEDQETLEDYMDLAEELEKIYTETCTTRGIINLLPYDRLISKD